MLEDLQQRKLKLLEIRRGTLEIWRYPEVHKRYVIGVDTSGGGPQGDFACAAVCETLTRSLEALWWSKIDPTEWGRMCARLGWYYNRALLAFETTPSQHGLSACNSARDAGYPNLFLRRMESTRERQMTEELGWATTSRTKGLMVDKVRVALKEKYRIPSARLLRELQQAKYKENGEVKFEEHDDGFIAYGIAQKVCDYAVQGGFVSADQPREKSWTERYWEGRNRELGHQGAEDARQGPDPYDGV